MVQVIASIISCGFKSTHFFFRWEIIFHKLDLSGEPREKRQNNSRGKYFRFKSTRSARKRRTIIWLLLFSYHSSISSLHGIISSPRPRHRHNSHLSTAIIKRNFPPPSLDANRIYMRKVSSMNRRRTKLKPRRRRRTFAFNVVFDD